MYRKTQVLEFRDSLIEGMIVSTPAGKSKLITKYPHVAETESGYWNWNEIYLAEKGFMCEDRKKLKGNLNEKIF